MRIKLPLFILFVLGFWAGGNLPLFAESSPARREGPTPTRPAATNKEVYATADDGTPLPWTVFAPSGPGRHPAILVIHGGGFIAAPSSPNTRLVAQDLAAAGYIAFEIEYRLAPPGHLAGQKSSGRFPDQTNDVHRAVHAARIDPRGNGQVGGVGGSAGGYHVAFAALTGTAGDDRIDVGVCLSGPYDFSDTGSQAASAGFKGKVINYAGSSVPAKLLAASPISFVTPEAAPLFLIGSQKESMPPQQLPDLVAKLLSTGVTTFQQQLTLPGRRHAFAYWPDVKEQSIAFLKAGFAKRLGAASSADATKPGVSTAMRPTPPKP